MNKTFLAALAFLLLPLSAFAHETHLYEIGGVQYEIVVGSLNEPIIVDDKTGLDLRIARAGQNLEGAQDSLQVEMLAAGKAKTENIAPVYNSPGHYKTTYIATVPTTIQYRIFGTLEDTPVDFVYECSPAGHTLAEPDESRTEISEGVTQTLKKGRFGCPEPKEAFGFPEPAAEQVVLAKDIEEVSAKKDDAEDDGAGNMLPILLSILALIVAAVAVMRQKSSN